MVSASDRVVIIGAGVFGLSLAYQLASEGNQNVMVMDRHVPPVSATNLWNHNVLGLAR
jgi:glycine/D-amino acid oxidase-like deaminating enzyme